MTIHNSIFSLYDYIKNSLKCQKWFSFIFLFSDMSVDYPYVGSNCSHVICKFLILFNERSCYNSFKKLNSMERCSEVPYPCPDCQKSEFKTYSNYNTIFQILSSIERKIDMNKPFNGS
ncbi:hypothetical protein MXB_2146 [Myxobolus squamalis]|nr:hypothetical protein MXB_2146 [Myxobolus squamalis]